MIRKGLMLSLIPLTLIVGLGLWGYLNADPAAQYPVHWGLDGTPDRFGGPVEAFLGLPMLALGLTALFVALPFLDPRGSNLRYSSPLYLTGWLGALGLMALIQSAQTLAALGVIALSGETFSRLVGGGVAALFLLMGNVLGKARPNWFVGVRTPWTLSSDLAWDKTHRLAGRLFVLVGLAGIAAALFAPLTATFAVVVGGAVLTAVVAVVYSWAVWRGAPDRHVGAQPE